MSGFDDDVKDNFDSLEKEMAQLTAKMKETVIAKTLEEVNVQFKKLQKIVDPIVTAFESFKDDLRSRDQKINQEIKAREESVTHLIKDSKDQVVKEREGYENIVEVLRDEISELRDKSKDVMGVIDRVEEFDEQIIKIKAQLNVKPEIKEDNREWENLIKELEKKFEDFKIDLLSRVQHGGGNANRQIRVEGVDVLTKYTDINFVGTTSSVTSSVDNTNKRININIPSGSGGAPGGADTQIQFNDAGSFGGDTGFTYNKTTDTVNVAGNVEAVGLLFTKSAVVLEETGAGTDVIAIQAPSSIASGYTLTLPVDDGTNLQFLQTNGSGVLAWGTALTTTTGDAAYLRLDAANSPMTNGFTISKPNGDAVITYEDQSFPGTSTWLGMFVGSPTWGYFNGETTDLLYFGGQSITFEPAAGGLTQLSLTGLTWGAIGFGGDQPNTVLTTPAGVGTNCDGSDLEYHVGNSSGNGSAGHIFYASGGGTSGTGTATSSIVATIGYNEMTFAPGYNITTNGTITGGTVSATTTSAGTLTATTISTGLGAVELYPSATYSPTVSAATNLDGTTTASSAQYYRVGNVVTVSGRFTADPTLTTTATSFELSLPIASNIGAVEDCAGVAFCGAITGQGAAITGSVANNTAVISWIATDITNQSWSYTYSYEVL